jgi:hypothetical protein
MTGNVRSRDKKFKVAMLGPVINVKTFFSVHRAKFEPRVLM